MPATSTDTREEPISGRPATEHADGSRAHRIAFANRLRRVEGQVKGIARMVEEEADCIETLTQVSAASHALRSWRSSSWNDISIAASPRQQHPRTAFKNQASAKPWTRLLASRTSECVSRVGFDRAKQYPEGT